MGLKYIHISLNNESTLIFSTWIYSKPKQTGDPIPPKEV